MNTATNTATPTLSKNYTRNRPIGYVTSNALDTLHPAELSWVAKQWRDFEGGIEDQDYNIIFELHTPISKTRTWVCDRDGPESSPMLMLPSDY